MKRYIRHVTINSGDVRDSYREEIGEGITEMLWPLIDRALIGEHTPVPGDVEPRCTLTGGVYGRCCSLTVWGPPLHPAAFPTAADISNRPVPIAEVGIAAHSRCGATLWRNLHAMAAQQGATVATDATHCPPEPWVAALLHAGASIYIDAMSWLGDFERCLAWAWWENVGRKN